MDDKELRRELKMISKDSKKLKSAERSRTRRGGGWSPTWEFRKVKSKAQNKLIRNAANTSTAHDFQSIDCFREKVNLKVTARSKNN